jgi:hypothetical protein
MADKNFRGMVHLNEEEMREAGDGVFAKRANDRTVGPTQKAAREFAKARKSAPENKDLGAAREDKAPALSGMTKAELIETAEAEGVKVETDDNKDDLVAKIEKKRGA